MKKRKSLGAKPRPKPNIFPLTAIFIFLFPLLFNPFGEDMFDGIKLVWVFVFLPLLLLGVISIRKVRWVVVSREGKILMLAGLFAAIASLFALLPREAFFGEYHRRTGALLFLIVPILYLVLQQYLSDLSERKWLTNIALSSSVIVAVFAILQSYGLFFTEAKGAFEGRAFSTLGNPVFLGSFLLIALPFVFTQENIKRWVGLVAYILLVGGIIASGSRVAMVGALVVTFAAFIFLQRERIFTRSLLLIGAVAVLFATLFAVFYLPRFISLPSDIAMRIKLVKVALKGVSDAPVFGFGWNRYAAYYEESKVQEELFLGEAAEVPDTSHSFFVDAAFSSGIVFALLMAAFLIAGLLRNASCAGKLAGIAVLWTLMFSPASMSVIIWLTIALSLMWMKDLPDGQALKIDIGAWKTKLAIAAVCTVALLVGVVSSYRILASDASLLMSRDALMAGDPELAQTNAKRAVLLMPLEKSFRANYAEVLLHIASLSGSQRDLLIAEREAEAILKLDPYSIEGKLILNAVKNQEHLINE